MRGSLNGCNRKENINFKMPRVHDAAEGYMPGSLKCFQNCLMDTGVFFFFLYCIFVKRRRKKKLWFRRGDKFS